MARAIRVDATYPHPPELVWTALTDPNELAQWLMPNDFQPRLGHTFTFRTRPAPGFDGIVQCRVTELLPPRRLAYTWKGGGIETVVTWSLEPVAGGTRLRLEHAGFQGARQLLLRKLILGPGWRRIVRQKLAAVLDRLACKGPADAS
jgi:uncharacterized protein YndB with AHSA1/START domain